MLIIMRICAAIVVFYSFSALALQGEMASSQDQLNSIPFYSEPGLYPLADSEQTFDLPLGWSFYAKEEAQELYPLVRGKPTPDGVVAIVTDEYGQSLALIHREIGYIKDYDMQHFDAAEMLLGLTEKYDEVNRNKTIEGQLDVSVKGWIIYPEYNSEQNTALWAIETDYGEHVVVVGAGIKLGRKGFTYIEWVSEQLEGLGASQTPLSQAAQSLNYNDGFRYGDYAPGDHIATEGIGQIMGMAGSGRAADKAGQSYAMSSLGKRFGIMLIAAIMTLLARSLLLRGLNKTMLSESKKAAKFQTEEPEIREVTAHKELKIIELGLDATRPNITEHRTQKLKQAKRAINLNFALNLVIGLVYLVVYGGVLADKSHIVSYLEPLTRQDISLLNRIDFHMILTAAFLVWISMRFIGDRNQIAWPRGLFSRVLNPFISFVCKFFNSTWSQAIGTTLMLFTFYLWLVLYIPESTMLIIAVVIHVFLWTVLRLLGKRRNNAKLLILRVFLMGKTSTFTFKNLAKAWKHFGSYFTVADPSFYKVTWKQKFNINFPLYIILLFALYTAVVDPNREIEASLFAGFIFTLLIGNILFVIFGRIKMKLKFMSTSAALEKRLKKLERAVTLLDGTFKTEPVMCYDNTWKLAVDGLIDTSDVVLMDLRGFSESNKGCAYEVNVLFDSKPSNNIVFLCYEEAVPLVRELIKTQWAELSDQSPNLSIEAPYTRLYQLRKEKTRDIEGIAEALLDAIGDPVPALVSPYR